MIVMNHCDSPPTFHGDLGQFAWIHMMVAFPSVASSASSWLACTTLKVVLDHYLIQMILDLDPHRNWVTHVPHWVMTNWKAFSWVLHNKLGLFLEDLVDSTEAINHCVMHLMTLIQRMINTITPKKWGC